MSKNLVPVTELPFAEGDIIIGADDPVANCFWNFELPPTLDAERIVIDMTRLQRVQKIGAVVSNVVSSYQGDVTKVTPGINGIQGDGTATASNSASVQQAERTKQYFIPEFSCPTHDAYGRVVLINDLNKAEMVSRISDQKSRTSKTREEIWAKELNDAFIKSFAEGVYPYMVGHSTTLRKMTDFLVYGLVMQDIADAVNTGDPALFAAFLPIWHALRIGTDTQRNNDTYGESLLNRKRWSLFPSEHQTDRYIAMKALLAVAPIIRARA